MMALELMSSQLTKLNPIVLNDLLQLIVEQTSFYCNILLRFVCLEMMTIDKHVDIWK